MPKTKISIGRNRLRVLPLAVPLIAKIDFFPRPKI